jgi:hypothetical protein
MVFSVFNEVKKNRLINYGFSGDGFHTVYFISFGGRDFRASYGVLVQRLSIKELLL